MREILHSELLGGTAVPAESRGASEVRGRMELAHEDALKERAPLAVMRIAVDGLDGVARSVAGGRVEVLLATVTGILRSLPFQGDLLAVREQDQVVAVLSRTDAAAAEVLARQLAENARRLAVRLSIGIAQAQFDAPYWFQTLLAVAQEGVEVAQSSGGGRCVHSELYSFHQRRLERMSPDRAKPVLPSPVAQDAPRPVPVAVPAASAPANGVAPAQVQPLAGLHALEDRVLALAREWTEEALAKALAETQKVHTTEVENLERRIQKLSRALEEAQSELEHSQLGAAIDPGVASAYRTVQGLRDPEGGGAKRDMLAKLFEANLELRTLLGRTS